MRTGKMLFGVAAFAMCLSIGQAQKAEYGVVSVGSTFQTVTLPQSYASMVVICTPEYTGTDNPAIVRVNNASGNSFDVRVQNPGDLVPVGPINVHYLVVEQGVYTQGQHGVKMEAVKFLSTQLAGAGNAAILLAYGLPYQGLNQELATAAANLALLTGIAGREGSGLYLCGEKANSQGAIDLGILPQGNGLGARAMLAAAGDGKMDALYVVAEDPLSSYPDRDSVAKALEQVPFLVVQDLFLSPTAEQADVVFPAASFAEKDGTFTNAERRIQRVRSGIKSPGEARTDGAILAALAGKLGSSLSFTGPAAIFAEIGKEVPAYAEFNFNEIGPQGVVWGGETLQPVSRKLLAVAGGAVVDGEFRLVTGSALYHSGTVSTRAKGPMAVLAEAYVELCREDAAQLQVADGDLVKVSGNGAELKLKVKVGNRLPKGVVFAPYHFAEAQVNRLYKGEAAVPVKLTK